MHDLEADLVTARDRAVAGPASTIDRRPDRDRAAPASPTDRQLAPGRAEPERNARGLDRARGAIARALAPVKVAVVRSVRESALAGVERESPAAIGPTFPARETAPARTDVPVIARVGMIRVDSTTARTG